MISKILEDLMFQNIGCRDKADFMRKASLMRNPEGFGEEKRCPECKSPIKKQDNGDQYCSKFNLSYEKEGGCFWHRYENGLNYWSSPAELIPVMRKKYGIKI